MTDAENFLIYCGGDFVTSPTSFQVKSPYSGEIAGTTFLAGRTELETATIKALTALEPMSRLASYEKYAILMQIASDLEALKYDFARLISLEAAKPVRYALAEVERSIQTFTVAAEEAKRLPGEYLSLDWTPAGKGKEGIVKYFPVGVIAGIAPFNFPLNLAVHKIAPAIASGSPIILKPASSTPLSTLMLARIIDRTDLPKGAVSILPMDRATGNRLVTDERISLLSFTGSPEVGWQMKQDAGKKKVVLELGGNAGVLVMKSADLAGAVGKCVTGAFSYSGQVCIHTQRIYVHKEKFDEFAGRFTEAVKSLKSGDPVRAETDISVMIDEPNAQRVEAWIRESVSQGAIVLAGGKRQGSYVEPTVLTGTDPAMKVCREEIFGPVVVLEKIDNIMEGIEKLNEGRFGLQAGVFTDSLDEMNLAFEKLKVGGVIVNDVPTFRVDHMPYGGMKDSGLGREGVRYAIQEMTEPRILVKNA